MTYYWFFHWKVNNTNQKNTIWSVTCFFFPALALELLVSEQAICRTAPATPGMLNIVPWISRLICSPLLLVYSVLYIGPLLLLASICGGSYMMSRGHKHSIWWIAKLQISPSPAIASLKRSWQTLYLGCCLFVGCTLWLGMSNHQTKL